MATLRDRLMHDWTLVSVSVDWKAGAVVLALDGPLKASTLVARGVRDFHMPRRFEWGPSVSVNETNGPSAVADGLYRLAIEMQSGDIIEIVAEGFDFPDPQR